MRGSLCYLSGIPYSRTLPRTWDQIIFELYYEDAHLIYATARVDVSMSFVNIRWTTTQLQVSDKRRAPSLVYFVPASENTSAWLYLKHSQNL